MCKFGLSWARMGLNGRVFRIGISTQDQFRNKIRSSAEPGARRLWDRLGGEKNPALFPGLGNSCGEAASVRNFTLPQPLRAAGRPAHTALRRMVSEQRKLICRRIVTARTNLLRAITLRPGSMGLRLQGEEAKRASGPEGVRQVRPKSPGGGLRQAAPL